MQHGQKLKERILETIKFYKKIFHKDEKEILETAKKFKDIIKGFNPEYATEIEAIAEGASVNPLWIYALNARSEIVTMFTNECTALYFTKTALLFQNWDWAEELENLTVIMVIVKNNNDKIIQMTEPGIIGKIGFNSYGIGVCLNFLTNYGKLDGIPIHIMLRSVLECKTLDDAKKILTKYSHGKAGNILVGTKNRDFYDIEYAENNFYNYDNSSDVFIHTNHYLSNNELNKVEKDLSSSFARYERSQRIIENINYSLEDAKKILSDKTNNDLPICRKYNFDEMIGNTGTICSIIMDLINLKLHITRGNPFENDFEIIEMKNF